MYTKLDKKYQFISKFDPATGFYMRTGVLDEEGYDTGEDPFMASFPELIDVGVMGHCVHGASGLCAQSGVQCYQDGLHIQEPNMSIEDFRRIAAQCRGKTFQFALGGRGDVDQHENFKEILECCRENQIVPNFTSSGLGFNDEIVSWCKEFCGAVAISWYRHAHTKKAIQMLLDAGVKTNIHYVLGKNSIDEAIERLKNNDFPKGINGVIFLLHKPVGLGKEWNVLSVNDWKVRTFFQLIDENAFDFKIGFDSCTVPGLLNGTSNVAEESIDTCEGGRWSCYISSDMKMLPCSFDNQELRWAVDLRKQTIEEAWNSERFENFRKYFKNSCTHCKDRKTCMGGCPIRREIVLCERAEKRLWEERNEDTK